MLSLDPRRQSRPWLSLDAVKVAMLEERIGAGMSKAKVAWELAISCPTLYACPPSEVPRFFLLQAFS